MKQDWDFVLFKDYEADMRESAARASAVITQLRQERDSANLFAAILVEAVGGTVTIPRHLLDLFAARKNALVFVQKEDFQTGGLICETHHA